MRNLITCLSVCVLSSVTFADTWTVDDDGKADFNYIQGALQIAVDGDEILVMPGTYTGTGATIVNTLGKEVWLHSSGGPEVTIIDGEGVRRGIQCVGGETSNTIIEGFTITGGSALDGGGMINIGSSPTLTNCIFENNHASNDGGGMHNYNSSPMLENCTFNGNSSVERGGGIYNYESSPVLTNCILENNTSSDGAGMCSYNYCNPILTDCTFENNTADAGGGMRNSWYSSPTLTGCTFENNTAYGLDWGGGGIFNYDDSSPALVNCSFKNNSSNNLGGAILNYYGSSPHITTCIFCGNDPNDIDGSWQDEGDNTFDEFCWPDCPDINGDGYVGITDLLAVIDVWGCSDCNDVDVNQDGIVNRDDLVIVIASWGACP